MFKRLKQKGGWREKERMKVSVEFSHKNTFKSVFKQTNNSTYVENREYINNKFIFTYIYNFYLHIIRNKLQGTL